MLELLIQTTMVLFENHDSILEHPGGLRGVGGLRIDVELERRQDNLDGVEHVKHVLES